mmetsp:Transcript_110490/g.312529  ORF Transcript_110490/g.312529 Transcript_110490/m.312529 type:complete len:217 (+) Transcript_110490:480-1130(+)
MHREVFDRLRTLLEEKLDDNIAHGRVDRCLLPERILSPNRRGHGGIFLRWLLVEDVTAEIGSAFGRLAGAEDEEALLLVGGADCDGVSPLPGVMVSNCGAHLDRFFHRLALVQGYPKESLRLLDFAKHPRQLVRVDVHYLHADHRRVDEEVAGLVERHLLVHQRGRLPHLLLDRDAAAEVESIEVELGHVGVALGGGEHLQGLVVGTNHPRRGEAE